LVTTEYNGKQKRGISKRNRLHHKGKKYCVSLALNLHVTTTSLEFYSSVISRVGSDAESRPAVPYTLHP
jgi:hypothetical protein